MVVVVEVLGVVGKVALHQVSPAVVVVVGEVRAHARLLLALAAVGNSRLHADVGEGAVAVVVVKRAGRGIVGHVDVGPAVAVIIAPHHAQTVILAGVDPGALGDVGEGSITIVVEEEVAPPGQAARAAEGRDSTVSAIGRAAHAHRA